MSGEVLAVCVPARANNKYMVRWELLLMRGRDFVQETVRLFGNERWVCLLNGRRKLGCESNGDLTKLS